jgi:hypothetical protein
VTYDTSIAVYGNALLGQLLYQPFGPVSGWTWANNTSGARVYDRVSVTSIRFGIRLTTVMTPVFE